MDLGLLSTPCQVGECDQEEHYVKALPQPLSITELICANRRVARRTIEQAFYHKSYEDRLVQGDRHRVDSCTEALSF